MGSAPQIFAVTHCQLETTFRVKKCRKIFFPQADREKEAQRAREEEARKLRELQEHEERQVAERKKAEIEKAKEARCPFKNSYFHSF
jgi:hypothetical protein